MSERHPRELKFSVFIFDKTGISQKFRAHYLQKLQKTPQGEPLFVTQPLSVTNLDGQFLSQERTFNRAWPDNEGQSMFIIESAIDLAPPELAASPHGFYDFARVQHIKDILNEQGLHAVALSRVQPGTLEIVNNIIIFGPDNTQMTVDFGFESRTEWEEFQREKKRRAMESETSSQRIKRNLKKIGKTIVHFGHDEKFMLNGKNRLTIAFTDRQEGGFSFANEDLFKIILEDYTSLYENFLKALYQEKGKPEPREPIIFSALI